MQTKTKTYSKNLRKAAMAKRVMVMIAVSLVVGLIVGGVSGYALKTHITAKNEEKEETHTSEQSETETLVYGAYDDRIFTHEISLDWGADDLDFVPLDCDMPDEQQEFLFYLCAGYNIDFTLVMSLIQYESNYDPTVISTTNDYGYMQINKVNHEWLTETLGLSDFLDPYENLRAGCYILRKLFEKYQDADLVLMAYNMGEDGATCLWEKGVFETPYTQGILTIQEQFNEQLEGD